MIKFSHIGQLHNVVRLVQGRRDAGLGVERIGFRGRVKLHGSNSAVVCHPDRLQPQSRNREISPDDDNLGFASFCAGAAQVAAFRELESQLRESVGLAAADPLALFGEWIGPGIQRGVAVSQLPARQWVMFAAAILDEQGTQAKQNMEGKKRYFEIPQIGERFAAAAIYSIADAPQWQIELDFGNRTALERAAQEVEAATVEVDARCPWAARFGIDGAGEGLVWHPLAEHFGDSDLFFKSKGERHQVVARVRIDRAALDPEQLANVAAFVAYALTEPRLAQGLEFLREQDLRVEMPNLGRFLAWIADDIRRECADELEHNSLEWKQVAKAINLQARTWFRNSTSLFV